MLQRGLGNAVCRMYLQDIMEMFLRGSRKNVSIDGVRVGKVRLVISCGLHVIYECKQITRE